jgi:outer membrane receptor protein involved in Fe transport
MVPSISYAAAAAEDDDEELEEVQVTGTRIQTPGATSANPIDSISAEDIRRLGIVNAADALLQLFPQNQSTFSDFAVADTRPGGSTPEDSVDRTQYFIGNTIANLRGLDPAFGTRTLTLIDGRRVVSSSSQADVVDLNIIPSNLLQRMDVVTGGASATYGSGAVAGVVNLVLNNRLTGFNLDMDYGVNEAGDGGSPHISASGGLPLFEGRGHALIGVEWQETATIQSCARARDWCATSRNLFTNSSGNTADGNAVLTGQLPGFESFPTRFQQTNVRYSQFSPNGVVLITGNPTAVSGFRFTDDGRDVEQYALGYRGGSQTGQTTNGDGPPITDGISMRSGNERKTVFTNFEFNFTERTTGYVQANYAKTEGVNQNNYTTSTNCVKFGTQGTRGIPSVAVLQGAVFRFTDISQEQQLQLRNNNFRIWLAGGTPGGAGTQPTVPDPNGVFGFNTGFVAPWYAGGSGVGAVGPGPTGNWPASNPANPPHPSTLGGLYTFGGRATGTWELVTLGDNNKWWRLTSFQITSGGAPAGSEVYYDSGTPDVLPSATGRNANAFLANLTPEALAQVQRGFGNSTTAGNGSIAGYIFGNNPCTGFTAIKKVWTPQFRRSSSNTSETMRAVVGVKGRFGRDWRWDASASYGQTDSASFQNNAATNIRQAFAMDAVIDDRAGSATFGQPVCRVTRDGVPVLDTSGRPLGDLPSIQLLAAGCQPLNIFGSVFSGQAAATQAAAIDYAFIDNNTLGSNNLKNVSITTNGTLWEGWGAGPLTGAFGVEYRKDEVNNSGSQGNYYEKFDIQTGWSDKFGGSTAQSESFMELNMPLVSGVPGINLWSINGAVRYNQIKNKGGEGTTGGSSTRNTTNWKFQTVFEPFDWMRLRLSRSRDLRAPGYRDLFLSQPTPGGPNFLGQLNPWRERTSASTENQQERVGTVTVGNPNLKPEVSNTLTLGLVLSPGGWAQGGRLTVDYYNIKVKDAFYTSYANANPVNACWEQSGNQNLNVNDPSSVYIFDRFDPEVEACKNITFAELRDAQGNAIPGSRDLTDIVWYNLAQPLNGSPYQRRGVDLALTYLFPLNKAFESLPGSVSLRLVGTRALEASGIENVFCFANSQVANGRGGTTLCPAGPAGTGNLLAYRSLIGQIRSGNYIPGISPSPKWTGNFQASYILGDLTTSLSARYIGGAKIDNTWCDAEQAAAGSCSSYQNAAGLFLNGSVDQNHVGPYAIFAFNASYDLEVANTKQVQVFGSINNLFNKDPPWVAGNLSGTTGAYDTMGRAYRMGVRLKF